MPAPSQVDPALAAVSRPGTPVRLYLADGSSAFVSSILAAGGGTLTLAPVRPAHGNLVLERLLGSVRIEAMIGGVPHVATTRVRSVSASGVVLDVPGSAERVQRRRFYRVQASAPVDVYLDVDGATRVRPLVDVSGGGCAVRPTPADADLAVGDRIPVVSLPLSAGQVFVGSAVVRRAEPREWGGGEGEVLGLEFVDVAPRERQRLVAWVTEQERAALRALPSVSGRIVPDVIVLLHDSEKNIRLKPGSGLSAKGVRVVVSEDEADVRPGARLEVVELRVGGQFVLRGPAVVERVEVTRGGAVATISFAELSLDGRARLIEALRG